MKSSSVPPTVSLVKDLKHALNFKGDIAKAITWLSNNDISATVPFYISMDEMDKRRINFLSMKAAVSSLTESETEELNQALDFRFDNKNNFKLFMTAMHNFNIQISASVIDFPL